MTQADARFWNDLAEKYAAQPVADVPAFERKKAITREHLRPDSAVLEIGCGTGSLALSMAPYAGHIHGPFARARSTPSRSTSASPSTALGPTPSSTSFRIGAASCRRCSTC
jgi:hypothetical protein